MKNINKLLISLLLVLTIVPAVFADGMMFHYIDHSWQIMPEDSQFCAINYKDGFENMIIAVQPGAAGTSTKAVWLFPVPARPEKVSINVVKGFPLLYGTPVDSAAKEKIVNMAVGMASSQVIFFPILLMRNFLGRGSVEYEAQMLSSVESKGTVTVYESIQKLGMTTELVTATDGAALTDYLSQKDLVIPAESSAILNEYIGKDYSFVVSWISNPSEFNSVAQDNYQNPQMGRYFSQRKTYGNVPSIFITFPTDKMYFPLKPTSVYGSEKVPAEIFVMGYAKPELYSEIKLDSKVEYFTSGRSYNYGTDLNDFYFNQQPYPIKYTKITLDPPSKYLVDDLWIKDSAPVNIAIGDFINEHYFVLGVILFILLSCIASLLAGLIIFRKSGISLWQFAAFGLFNILSIFVFAIAVFFLRTKEVTKDVRKYLGKNGSAIIKEQRRLYDVYLIIMGIMIVLWLFLGRNDMGGFLILFVPCLLIFMVISIFILSQEKIKDKYEDYFDEHNIYLKLFNFKKFTFLSMFNIIVSPLAMLLVNTNYDLHQAINEFLGFITRYNYSYNSGFRVNSGNLEVMILMIVFAVSILIVFLLGDLFEERKGIQGLYIMQKDWVKKVLFVLLFSIIFLALTAGIAFLLALIV